MRTRYLIYFLVLLFSVESYTQEVSQIHQFFAMNPMIKRDPLFQDIQAKLQQHNSATGRGFNENVSIRYLSQLRKWISGLNVDISYDLSKDVIEFKGILSKGDTSVLGSIAISNSSSTTLENILDETNENTVKLLSSFIDGRFIRPTSSSSTEGQLTIYILGRFYEGISNKSINPNIGYPESLRNLLRAFKSELDEYLDIVKNESEFITELNKKAVVDKLVKVLDKELKTYLSVKKEQLNKFISIVESEIESLKEDVSKALIAANTGISVSSDEGNLGAGLYASLKTEKSLAGMQLEIGAYINGAGEVYTGEVGSDSVVVKDSQGNDTTKLANDNVTQPFLAGFAMKWQINHKVQFNGLLTYHILNAEKIDASASVEVGGGVLYNTQSNLILGLSGFYQFLDKPILIEGERATIVDSGTKLMASSIWSVGLTFQNTIPGSPMIMVGITKQRRNPILPAIQISYPINFN